jgi:hypothetical protein
VRLTVPGDGAVTVRGGDVSASRDGDTVTFRPSGSIAANNSLTFSFVVGGTLSALPSGCSVDGAACS